MLTIIIPTCTDTLVNKLLMTLRVSSPAPGYQVTVADNGLSAETREKHSDVTFVKVTEPFSFARAVNEAVRWSQPHSDIVVMNDDVVVQSERFVESLEQALALARSHGFGVISPIIRGGVGNPDQAKTVPQGEIHLTRKSVCFVTAAVPREVWNELGGLDEEFLGYGFEDTDFCRRVVEAGWKLGVTGAARVEHGDGEQTHSVTFIKKFGGEKFEEMFQEASNVFKKKWGDGPQLGAYETGRALVDRPIGIVRTA